MNGLRYSSPPWTDKLQAGLVQLVEGLVSPRVELGVGQARVLIIEYLSRYWFAERCAHRRSPSGTCRCEEIELRGPNCECQRHK
jgi:hypothetical protein